MLMCPYEFDVALRGIKVKNVTPSLSLVGHPTFKIYLQLPNLPGRGVKIHWES